MCITIIQGVQPKDSTSIGIDMFTNIEQEKGEMNDSDFFVNNCGEGTYFPGGPSCVVNGVKVSCLIR